MPAEIPRHKQIRLDFKDSAEKAIALYGLLDRLIAVKSRQPSGAFHGKIDFSQPPWCAPVAHAVTDLHALSRKIERELRSELGLPQRIRGGSDSNTAEALQAALKLAESADDVLVRFCITELERWVARASVALGLTEFPEAAAASPGSERAQMPVLQEPYFEKQARRGTYLLHQPEMQR